MREIKFRAWDKEKKIMSDSFNFSNVTDCMLSTGYYIVKQGEMKVCPDGMERPIFTNFDVEEFGTNIELMQFTGLKDKNGKEIYDGDIVEVGNRFYKAAKQLPIFISDVHDITGGFGVFINEHAQEDYLSKFSESGFYEVEVIGNIYENPELLEENGK